MMKRPLMAAGLTVAVVLGAVAGLGTQASAARRQAGGVKITGASVRPSAVFGGQPVTVDVTVGGRNVTVNSVVGYATYPGGNRAGNQSPLTSLGNGKFSGSVTIPPNNKGRRLPSKIYVVVNSSKGRVRKAVATVRVKPGSGGGGGGSQDPNSPPPPPNI